MGSGRLPVWSRRRLLAATAALSLGIAVPAVALAHAAERVAGNAPAGKPVFVSTCGVCHRLKAAATVGSVGPNLDRTHLTEPTLVKAIANGGASVMTKSAVAQYSTHMTAYRNVLTTTQIQNVAVFIYVSTRK